MIWAFAILVVFLLILVGFVIWQDGRERLDTVRMALEESERMTKRLSEKPVNSSVDAMETLNAASVSWTEWSCVYQLSDFSVDIVLDNKHSKVFHISQEDFK